MTDMINTWPPPGDPGKKFNREVAFPALILDALGHPLDAGARRELRTWLLGIDPAQSFEALRLGSRSWNHAVMHATALGLVLGDWTLFDRIVTAQVTPGLDRAEWGFLALLEGDEIRSSDYAHMRLACYIIGSAKAPRAIAEKSVALLRLCLGAHLLGAVSWTDEVEFRSARGGNWWDGMTLSPVGERSPKTSNPDLLHLVSSLAGSGSTLSPARMGWASIAAESVGLPAVDLPATTPPGILAGILDRTSRFFGAIHFAEYATGRLVWRPEQLNPLTPSALWSWADHAAETQVRGYPYDPLAKNRGKEAPRSTGCRIERSPSGVLEVVATSTAEGGFGRSSHPIPEGPPLWSVTLDESGCRYAEGALTWDASAPGPEPIPPPSTPPSGPAPTPPGPSVEDLVAAVVALEGQPAPTALIVEMLQHGSFREAADAVEAMEVRKRLRGARGDLAAVIRGRAS